MTDIVYRKKDGVVSRQIAGETILVPIMGSLASMQKIFMLNSVGEFIWARLDGIKSLCRISEEIAVEFGLGNEQALADSQEFLSDLLREGLAEEAV
jgi:hypothetical protein